MRPELRDELISELTAQELDRLVEMRAERAPLDPAEAAGRIAGFLRTAMERVLDGVPEGERPDAQARLVNELLSQAGSEQRLALPPEVLFGLVPEGTPDLRVAPQLPPRPQVPLSASDLLVNGVGQPSIGSELKVELQSADEVDLICAFVIWSGVRVLRDVLAGVIERGGSIRVITTTYMGATEPRALIALAELGAQIRVAYDAQSTKLHAKSWLLERPGGLSTAFVGSSNLSHTALHDGLEWNVRLAQADAPHLLERVRATFETHWQSEHFEPFDPKSENDRTRLATALGGNAERRRGESISFAGLDVHPYPHQQRMLDRLAVERRRHDRHRNLVVAATGTGKTVVAALDYRALCKEAGRDRSLLFVAHRDRILRQSLATFRQVMRDGSFGEILGDGREPVVGKHVFAMIQSLTEQRLQALDPEAYDVIIIDEFHHAAAPSYDRLLSKQQPSELLGLTATPERMDGRDVTEWFGGRVAVELRLWEAIDQGFLVPFQYFGVADGTDLSEVTWSRGRYAPDELARLYVDDDQRVAKLLQGIADIIDSPTKMRALGFCVSVDHAEYMAEQFRNSGQPAVALSGSTPNDERERALASLARGELRAIFSVDVLGEGVDVPDVDTVLLLRPTDSATVFTQQIGRGLRRSEGKRCLTVIDMIGQQRREFRFDRRLRVLVDERNGPVRGQAERGFPMLPAGCDINLDRVSEELVLANLRDAARLGRWPALVEDLRGLGDISLVEFLRATERAPDDLYKDAKYSWTRLRREAGLPTSPGGQHEDRLLRAVGRLLHVDDSERISLYRDLLLASEPPEVGQLSERVRRLILMLHFDLWGVRERQDSLETAIDRVWLEESVRDEIVELLAVLNERSERLVLPLGLADRIPVSTHGRYTRDEILAGFGVGTVESPPSSREGVYWAESERADLLFVTLHKSESDYSPTTMYRDYAISPTLFHWESQSTLGASAPTARRYVNHQTANSDVVLFVRSRKNTFTGATMPYTCLGPADYVEHQGERPMSITWRLRHRMPEELFEVASAVAV